MIVSVDEFKTFFKVSANDDATNALITSILEAAQKYCEKRTDRGQFESGVVTKAFPGDGAAFLYLNERPATFDFGSGDYVKVDGEAIAEENIVVYGDLGKVELLNGYKFTEDKKIEVKFTGGYEAENAPSDLKKAICCVAGTMWSKRTAGIKEKKVGDFTIKYTENGKLEEIAEEILDSYRVCAI